MASVQQKQVLQYFLRQPLISSKEFEKIYAIIFEKQGPIREDDLKGVVRTLNDILKPTQLAIKFRRCEDNNEEYYSLINLIESEAAKHTSEFTTPEFELFKWIMKEIVSSDSGTVSSIDCINQSFNIQKLTKSDAQKALDKFISSHWLKEREGELSFTVRTLLELEPMLKKIDDELEDCKICGTLAVKRLVCPGESCGAKVHRYCLSKLSRAIATLKCPMCSRPWSNLAEENGNSSNSQTPSQKSTQKSRGQLRPRVYTSSDDE